MNPVDQIQLQAGHLVNQLTRQVGRRFPQALWEGDTGRPEVALTFDDGPHPRDTPQLLDILAQHGAPATFFNIGVRLEQFPHLARAVAAAGHQIGLHGYVHEPFTLAGSRALRLQLNHFQKTAARVCERDPALFRDVRPPYGVFTPRLLRLLIEWGYRPVMWTVVPHHRFQSIQATVEQVAQQTAAGSLLVFHEGWVGPPVAQVIDQVVPRLRAAGFTLVTIDRMWQTRIGAAPMAEPEQTGSG